MGKEERIVSALKRVKSSLQWENIGNAEMGPLDSDGNATTPTLNLEHPYVWVRRNGSRHEVRAKNLNVPDDIPNLPVIVGENIRTQELEVISIDPIKGPAFLGNAAASTNIPRILGGTFRTEIPGRNFKPGRLKVLSGLTLYVEAFWYYDSNGDVDYWPGLSGGTVTVTPPSQVSSVDQQQWSVVTFDNTAGAAALTLTDVATRSVALPLLQPGDLVGTAIPDEIRIGAARNRTGDTALPDDALEDLRVWVNPQALVSLPTATTTTLGGVLLDENPASGDPIALTAPRYDTPYGVAPLQGDRIISSLNLPYGEDAGIAQSSRWTRSPNNPIIFGTEAWENDACGEACVIPLDDTIYMFYSAGWNAPSLGLATCPIDADPTDPANWTKEPSNPVFTTDAPGQPHIIWHEGLFRYYYVANSYNLKVATSPDGLTWTVLGVVMNPGGAVSQWANTAVWVENGNQWHMIIEGLVSGVWLTYLAESSDGLTFTLANGGAALTSLQVASGGTYGGPFVPRPQKFRGKYQLWYHAAPVVGNTPTNIYHAESSDLIAWTRPEGSTPALTCLGSGFEIDQVGDPDVVEINGKSYLFYVGVDNPNALASIGVASFDGPLSALLAGAEWPVAGGVEGVTGTSPITVDNTDPDNPVVTHATSGVTPGTYTSVTVNDKGHVTAGSNPDAAGQYRQFLYVLDGLGDFQFLTDGDGHPLMALMDLE